MLTDNVDKILFSCLSGYNMYVPSRGSMKTMVHILNNTDVDVRYIDEMDIDSVEEKWRYFVENPVDIKNILWPIDIVYTEDKGKGLIFRKRAFPKMKPIKDLLYNSDLLDWNRPEIKTLIQNLLTIFQKIHMGGYAYHSFDINHIYYNESTWDILVDFSLAMSRHYNNIAYISEVDVSSVQIEFLPPWIPIEKRNYLTLADDYYSIEALLFRLMVGRMPYQGRMMDGHGDIMDVLRDTDPGEHERMFEYYHEIPVFIFDEDDRTNSIGRFTHEMKIVDRWKSLPDNIRKIFLETFSKENIRAGYIDKKLYSAEDWILSIQQS